MSDSTVLNLIIVVILNFVLWCIMIILWFLTARKDRQLALKSAKSDRQLALAQWKYNMKSEHYGLLSEALKRIIDSQSIIKMIQEIDIENKNELKTNYIHVETLASLTHSEIITSNIHDINQQINTIGDLTVKRLSEMSGIISDGCIHNFYTSYIDMMSQREWIELYEPDNIVIKELNEGWDKLLGEESKRMYGIAVLALDELEYLLPLGDPEWIKKINLEYEKLRNIMKYDLKKTF